MLAHAWNSELTLRESGCKAPKPGAVSAMPRLQGSDLLCMQICHSHTKYHKTTFYGLEFLLPWIFKHKLSLVFSHGVNQTTLVPTRLSHMLNSKGISCSHKVYDVNYDIIGMGQCKYDIIKKKITISNACTPKI